MIFHRFLLSEVNWVIGNSCCLVYVLLLVDLGRLQHVKSCRLIGVPGRMFNDHAVKSETAAGLEKFLR